ncbi:hypothetical protein AB0D67_03775 [Streptosporangium sp. NPDC048047]|uniref:hypothetical protein n=1 Tax=Streptosporangium sp. NPDC048047 TaxID=3155748 RepID=UPI00341D09FF
MARKHAIPVIVAVVLGGMPVLGAAGTAMAAAPAPAAVRPALRYQPPYPPPIPPVSPFDELEAAALLAALADATQPDEADEEEEQAREEDENPFDPVNAIINRAENAVANAGRPDDDDPHGQGWDPTRGLGGGDGDCDDGDGCCGGGGGCCGPGCAARKEVRGQAAQELPYTGAPVGLLASVGGGLLAAGSAVVLISARRRRSPHAR